MKALIVGNGKSGSWKIRGEQLGAAIGAKTSSRVQSVEGFDTLIVVKRSMNWLGLVREAKKRGVRVVFDVLDGWPRAGNDWDRQTSLRWMRDELSLVNPDVIVAATRQMAIDCSMVHSSRNFCLHHHARPDQESNPIRDEVTTVGYEGGQQYLGSWQDWIEAECEHRGWRFVVNPPSLSQVDIVVAVRCHLGYTTRNWKSNVKLANAQATGTPCVINREAGYQETESGGELWADDRAEMRLAFDRLADKGERQMRSDLLRQMGQRVTLASAAATYEEELNKCVLNS